MSSPARPRYSLVLAAALLLLFYPIFAASNARLMLAMHNGPETLIAAHELPQSDFGLFWCAGKGLAAKAAQRFGLIGPDPAYQQICQLDVLANDAPQALAWPYPPPAGFVVLPLAVLPLPLSFWVWRVLCLVLGGWLLRRSGLGWAVIVAGLASPASLHDMTGGQNGTITGAMLVAILLWAPIRPRAAGMLAGLLALKPQLGILLPAIIWRRSGLQLMLAGLCTVLVLVLGSLVLWGPEQWAWFLRVAEPDEMRTAALPFSRFFPAAGITVYDMAHSLGAAPRPAWTVQLAASAVALALTFTVWREGVMQPVPRMALTVCLTLLAMPHGFS